MEKIKILHYLTRNTKELVQLAAFSTHASGDGYGIKRFITELGEVAIINFNISGIPDALNDIAMFYESNAKYYKSSISIDIDYAWRYFADKSSSGFIWYLEGIAFTSKCKEEMRNLEFDLVSKCELIVYPQTITFSNWLSLNASQKTYAMRAFLMNPIKSTHPIDGHYSEINSNL